MTTDHKPIGKERFCWNCGKSMGWVENKFYDRMDTCGERECTQAERNVHQACRDEAHEELDRDMGWGGW